MSSPNVDELFPVVKNPLNLPTYQRRLRHLSEISVRNLQLPKNQTVDFTKLQVHFTLHKNGKDKALYTSETITGSLNPSWQNFDLRDCDEIVDLSTKYVVVRVWMSHGSESKVKIEANVHLSGLVYFADTLQVEGVKHQPNTLLYGMYGGFFIHYNPSAANPQLVDLIPDKVVAQDRLPVATIVEQSLLKPSYNTSALSRMHTVKRAIKQAKASVRRIHSQLEDKLMSSTENAEKISQREELVVKVRQLRHELLWQTQKKQTEQEALDTLRAENEMKMQDMKNKEMNLNNLYTEIVEGRDMYIETREMLVKENAHLLIRRKQIMKETLELIYPITEDEKNNSYICNVKLPNAESYQGQDETKLAIALGFACHMVQLVSQFMDMPLRYPMMHRGSRSIIIDHIHSKLSDRDREFPLYGKGKEKFQFNYAVFLLNKNISQLRFYCGLGTSDLRTTLQNIKTLFETRLLVRSCPGDGSCHVQCQGHIAPPAPSVGESGSRSTASRSPSHEVEGHNARVMAGVKAAEAWAATLPQSDLDGSSCSTEMSAGVGGDPHAAAMVEGIGLTSFNGTPQDTKSHPGRVIVKPLVRDRQGEVSNGKHQERQDIGEGHQHKNGKSSVQNTSFGDQSSNGVVSSDKSKNNSSSSSHRSGGAIFEEDETESDELFKPSLDDSFFKVKKTQDAISSALEGSDNRDSLTPALREQVIDISSLPCLSEFFGHHDAVSPGYQADQRTFKLVKSVPEKEKTILSPPHHLLESETSGVFNLSLEENETETEKNNVNGNNGTTGDGASR